MTLIYELNLYFGWYACMLKMDFPYQEFRIVMLYTHLHTLHRYTLHHYATTPSLLTSYCIWPGNGEGTYSYSPIAYMGF